MSYTVDPRTAAERLAPVPSLVIDLRDVTAAGGAKIRFGCVTSAQSATNRDVLNAALVQAGASGKAVYLPPGCIEVGINQSPDFPVQKLLTVSNDVTVIGAGSRVTTIRFACGSSADNSLPTTEFAMEAWHVDAGVAFRLEGVTLEGPSLLPEAKGTPDSYGYRVPQCIWHAGDHNMKQGLVKLVDVRITGWFFNAIQMEPGDTAMKKGSWLDLTDCDISSYGVPIGVWAKDGTPGKRLHARNTCVALTFPPAVLNGFGQHYIYANPNVSLELVGCRFGAERSGIAEAAIQIYSGGNNANPPAEYVRVIDCTFERNISVALDVNGRPAKTIEVIGCTFRSRVGIQLKVKDLSALISRCTFASGHAAIGAQETGTRVEILDSVFDDMLYAAFVTNQDQTWLVDGCTFQRTGSGPIVDHTGGDAALSKLHVLNSRFTHGGTQNGDRAIQSGKRLIVERSVFVGSYAGIRILAQGASVPTTLVREVDTTGVTLGYGVEAGGAGLLTGSRNRFNSMHPVSTSGGHQGRLFCREADSPTVAVDPAGVLPLSYDYDTYVITGWSAPLKTIYVGGSAGTAAFGGVVRILIDPALENATTPLTIAAGGNINVASLKSALRYSGGQLILAHDPDAGLWHEIDEYRKLHA